jgi:uncharacterized protein (DUF2344 family)
MTFNNSEKESSSNVGDTIVDFNLITHEEADMIYKMLSVQSNKDLPIKRNWKHDEVKLLDFAVDHFCQTNNRTISKLTTKDWK